MRTLAVFRILEALYGLMEDLIIAAWRKIGRRRNLVLIAACVGLSACASSTPIQRYTESKSKFRDGVPVMSTDIPQRDWYRVFVQGATGFVPMSALREDVEDRAEKFASRQGKSMVLLGERISQPPYILGNFPRIEIVFAAVNK